MEKVLRWGANAHWVCVHILVSNNNSVLNYKVRVSHHRHRKTQTNFPLWNWAAVVTGGMGRMRFFFRKFTGIFFPFVWFSTPFMMTASEANVIWSIILCASIELYNTNGMLIFGTKNTCKIYQPNIDNAFASVAKKKKIIHNCCLPWLTPKLQQASEMERERKRYRKHKHTHINRNTSNRKAAHLLLQIVDHIHLKWSYKSTNICTASWNWLKTEKQ